MDAPPAFMGRQLAEAISDMMFRRIRSMVTLALLCIASLCAGLLYILIYSPLEYLHGATQTAALFSRYKLILACMDGEDGLMLNLGRHRLHTDSPSSLQAPFSNPWIRKQERREKALVCCNLTLLFSNMLQSVEL